MNKANLNAISKLLDDFENSIENRSIVFLTVWEEVFPKILEWHFEIWKKEYTLLKKEKQLDEWGAFADISRKLDEILEKIEIKSLSQREAYAFFESFKKHAEKHKKEFVKTETNDHYYYESLFSIFYREFFKIIAGVTDSYEIWEHYFPTDWKVTVQNLKNNENILSRVSLDEFLKWAQQRIWKDTEETDRDLDNVSANLFPDVDPSYWATILMFVFSTYGDSKIRSIIERPWNFGQFGRMHLFSVTWEEDDTESQNKLDTERQAIENSEKENTFELTYLLFSREFSRENLEKYVNSLSDLRYEDELNKSKRLRLLRMFEEMLEYIKKK